ncbi:unnamed protein product [Trichobilharzia regenti]|nr:unnamed protein product [Trichobilharzia regenti]
MATFKGAAREAQRAALLMKQREKERQELELQKRKLEAEMRVGEMSTKFAVHYDAIEHQLKTNTSLLSFAEEEDAEDILKPPSLETGDSESADKTDEQNQPEETVALDGDDSSRSDNETQVKRRRLGKNPTVDTSFLPDIDRDEEEKRLR